MFIDVRLKYSQTKCVCRNCLLCLVSEQSVFICQQLFYYTIWIRIILPESVISISSYLVSQKSNEKYNVIKFTNVTFNTMNPGVTSIQTTSVHVITMFSSTTVTTGLATFQTIFELLTFYWNIIIVYN